MSKDEQVPGPSSDELKQNWEDWRRNHELDQRTNAEHGVYPWYEKGQDKDQDKSEQTEDGS